MRYCDVVMKGGITSGVVYPLAAVELARHYRFKNVGGTSAGAIAAAGVAAAEHGRSHGKGTEFKELAELPAWLGRNLTSLFQPSRGTRPLFAMLLAASKGTPETGLVARIEKRWPRVGRALRVAVAAGRVSLAVMRGFPLAVLLGAVPGLLLGWAGIASASGAGAVWTLVCALALIIGGITLAVALAIARRTTVALPENGFGLVSGYAEGSEGGVPPLTTWLADLLDRLAGKEGDALTFRDLWGPDEDERDLNLEMMTTCLTQARPYRLPFASSEFWFDPDELGRLFPKRIVDQMVRKARKDPRADEFAPLRPLPEPADLPVVVAVRMSLSFPVLISAVPLYGFDYSQQVADEERKLERCWFSDGGITSNFPVHFFDSPVPRWPTFAIDLRKLPGGWEPSDVESENVWMVRDNHSQGDIWWYGWDELPSPGRRLTAFAGSIARTFRTWVDQTQSEVHGYRDRIVHIDHSAREGGLNLVMPEDVIARLSERGGCAGARLRERFSVPPATESPMTWDNQRWIRYRTFMHLLERALAGVRRGYLEQADGDHPFEELSRRGPDDLPEYAWGSPEHREWALAATAAVIALPEEWSRGGQSFTAGSPEPMPELRVSPRV